MKRVKKNAKSHHSQVVDYSPLSLPKLLNGMALHIFSRGLGFDTRISSKNVGNDKYSLPAYLNRRSPLNPTTGKWWIVHSHPTDAKSGVDWKNLRHCRLDLNNPPPAGGGISGQRRLETSMKVS